MVLQFWDLPQPQDSTNPRILHASRKQERFRLASKPDGCMQLQMLSFCGRPKGTSDSDGFPWSKMVWESEQFCSGSLIQHSLTQMANLMVTILWNAQIRTWFWLCAASGWELREDVHPDIPFVSPQLQSCGGVRRWITSQNLDCWRREIPFFPFRRQFT